MTIDELRARIELIKKRQKAATSSTGTKALLIQTFSEDLPWLIQQAERLADAEAALAECEQQRDALAGMDHAAEHYRKERDVAERKLAAAREALQAIATDPHINYGYHDTIGGQYGIGITDGHRCAASKAQDALAALTEADEGEIRNDDE